MYDFDTLMARYSGGHFRDGIFRFNLILKMGFILIQVFLVYSQGPARIPHMLILVKQGLPLVTKIGRTDIQSMKFMNKYVI